MSVTWVASLECMIHGVPNREGSSTGGPLLTSRYPNLTTANWHISTQRFKLLEPLIVDPMDQ